MEETPAKQYIFAPAVPIYHLALNDRLSLCGLWLHGNADERRRRDDRRLATDQPDGQLCSACDRKSSGKPEPEKPSLELLSPSRYIDIII